MKKFFIFNLLLAASITFAMAQNTINQLGSNGLKQGSWEEKTPSGTTKGTYSNDKKDGCWTSYAADGKLTKIENFKLGLRDGITIEIDQRGYLVSESYYVNNLLEGTAKKFFYGTNLASSIDYLHGKINGKKKIYYENSAGKLTEESEYKDDVKNGASTFYSINGDPVAEYTYVNNMLQGVQKTYFAGKKIMSEQEFNQNVENGFSKEYYENGKLKSEGFYVKGVLSGVWKSYNEEGILLEEGSYINGEKEGKWMEYDAAGKVTKTTKYMKGQVK